MSDNENSLDTHYEHAAVESHVKQHWDEVSAYEYTKRSNEGNERFYFVDGPPFTSGKMHCGTAWGKILKDSLLRYHRMQGKDVVARPGYDTHGLPIEVKVEQQQNFETKKDVEEFGLENFVEECRSYATSQREVMDREFKDMGVWMDWDDVYETMSADYMTTVWSVFAELHDNGFIGRGNEVLNTCPRCETALSDSELDYSNRTVTAAYVGFPLEDEDDARLVTWTTTPWTVVGNQFVAVNEQELYAEVSCQMGTLYLAQESVADVLSQIGVEEYTVENVIEGAELVGRNYRHPLSEMVSENPTQTGRVAHADYVELEKTGLVHSAPGFGHEDYEKGSELGLEPFSPVGTNGTFTTDAGPYNGLYVHDEGTEAVLEDLSENEALLGTESYTHEYPECPRCDTDVVFKSMEQWFVTVTEMKEELLSSLDQSQWYPSDARDEKFKNTVENAPDWNISRQRYWGTPLPVWVCESCEHDTVVSDPDELCQRSPDLESPPEDLHRPSVDDVVVTCASCGGDAHRIEDVLDVWFDSSVASWASKRSNMRRDDTPDEWPADLVVEGYDQTRGWFLMQLYQGVALENRPPYKEVLMHGFALLDNKPMSKSRNHVLRPPEVIDTHGRDSLRAYLLSHQQQEQDVNMSSDMSGVADMQQKLDVIWNVYRFAMLYMNEDDYTHQPVSSDDQLRTLDKWVLTKLSTTVDTATRALQNRNPHKALTTVLSFLVDDLSRYYVKSIRDRVWTLEMTDDKKAVYNTLSTVLHTGTRLLAPFTPYLSEYLFQSLPAETEPTVHATDWPQTEHLLAEPGEQLLEQIATVRNVEQAVAQSRHEADRKKRWPVQQVVVTSADESVRKSITDHESLITSRVNTDNITIATQFDELQHEVKADMSVFGPQFKQDAGTVASKINGLSPQSLPQEVTVEDKTYTVTTDMVSTVETLPETVVASEFEGGRVFVDMDITRAQQKRGLARDVVRRLQEMRKQLQLDMNDKVDVHIETDDVLLSESIEENKSYISQEVRVTDFSVADPQLSTTHEIENSTVTVEMALSA